MHAELRHGHGVCISHERVWRCMKLVGLQGVHRRRWRGHKPATASWPDLFKRHFRAQSPDWLWVTATRAEMTPPTLEYIEAFHNPVRRHSALDYHSSI